MLSDLFPSVRDRAGLKIIEEVRRFDIASRLTATWMPARAFGNAKRQVVSLRQFPLANAICQWTVRNQRLHPCNRCCVLTAWKEQ
jgi:hypothetical protein